jgi:hypothetical protein
MMPGPPVAVVDFFQPRLPLTAQLRYFLKNSDFCLGSLMIVGARRPVPSNLQEEQE